MRMSDALAALGTYPFLRLTAAKQERLALGGQVVDFGVGEPREETPAFIRSALVDAVAPLAPYPHSHETPSWSRDAVGRVSDCRPRTSMEALRRRVASSHASASTWACRGSKRPASAACASAGKVRVVRNPGWA